MNKQMTFLVCVLIREENFFSNCTSYLPLIQYSQYILRYDCQYSTSIRGVVSSHPFVYMHDVMTLLHDFMIECHECFIHGNNNRFVIIPLVTMFFYIKRIRNTYVTYVRNVICQICEIHCLTPSKMYNGNSMRWKLKFNHAWR